MSRSVAPHSSKSGLEIECVSDEERRLRRHLSGDSSSGARLTANGFMIVEDSSSSSPALHRFLDLRFLPHTRSRFVVNAGLVDSSKYSCISYEGVIRLLTQAARVHALSQYFSH